MSYIVAAIFGYFLYLFVVRFAIPVFTTARRIKRQFNDVRERSEAFYNQQNPQGPAQNTTPNPPKTKKEPVGEYIDFEEIRE
ncbi:MAG: hypothetical protein QM727_13090 [Niabella sp.]